MFFISMTNDQWELLLLSHPTIDLFHNNFSPSGTQPEHRKLAHEL